MTVGGLDVELAPQQSLRSQSLLKEVWETKAWRLAPVIFVYVLAVAILLPAKPDILTDFFASQQAGRPVSCEKLPNTAPPEVCRNAHSDAVWWASFSDFVSHSIITFLLAPLVGRWSDRMGRRPFIALFLGVASIPNLLLAAHINLGVSLYYYFPAQAFAGSNMLVSLSTAYISDLVSAMHRASAIGLVMASFAVAFLLGPPLGAILGLAPASLAALGGTSAAFLLVLLGVPESLSQLAKERAHEKQRSEGRWARLPWQCMRILARSDLFLKLAACTAIIGFVSLGLLELLAQYLQLKLAFTKMDLAVVITIAGAAGLLTQTVILKLLMRWLGESKIVILGSASRVLEQLALCFAFSRASVVVAILIGALAQLTMPAISSLVSKNSEAHEQGTALGALYGMLALSQGFGPLVFAYLFSGFTRSDSTWTYFPGAPYLFGAGLMAIATGIACTIDAQAADRGTQPDHYDGSYTGESLSLDEPTLTTKPSIDLSAAGGGVLIQRQPSAYASGGGSGSLDAAAGATQRRSGIDAATRGGGSVDSRLPPKRTSAELK